MVKIHTLHIEPPVVNSSCAWATDYEQLRELYDSPYTGALITRTATFNGFSEDASNVVSEEILPHIGRRIDCPHDAWAGCVLQVECFFPQLLRLLPIPTI